MNNQSNLMKLTQVSNIIDTIDFKIAIEEFCLAVQNELNTTFGTYADWVVRKDINIWDIFVDGECLFVYRGNRYWAAYVDTKALADGHPFLDLGETQIEDIRRICGMQEMS